MVTESHNSGIRRKCDEEKTRQLPRGGSPLIAWDIEVGAQRPPHTARLHSVLDGLRGRTALESSEHVVDEQRTTPRRAELAVHELIEFGQPHGPNLPSASWHTRTGSATSDSEAPARCAAARWVEDPSTAPTAAVSESPDSGRTS